MAYERIDREPRTPEEAAGYREMMREALYKVQLGVGEVATETVVSVSRLQWPEIRDRGEETFGIFEDERLPHPKPFEDTYIDPELVV